MTDPVGLSPTDAGELLTLQRAAYVVEAQVHDDPRLPPLVQTLDALRDELAAPSVRAWGVREDGRLIASVRVRLDGPAALLGRLVTAPDRQREGLGTRMLRHVETALPDPTDVIELFTGEYSHANLRRYRSLGYRDTHRTRAGGYDLLHLEKPLAGVVRRARPDDLEAILAVLGARAAWLHGRGIVDQWPVPFPRAAVTPDLAAGRTWVAEDAAGVVATFTLGADDDSAVLHRLAVRPGHPGLGAEMLARVQRQLAHAGHRRLRLECVASNDGLCAYYRRVGFTERDTRTVHAVPGDGWPPGASAELRRWERELPVVTSATTDRPGPAPRARPGRRWS